MKMRSMVPLLMLLLVVMGCGRHYPSEAEKRKYFGDSFIYQGAPFCCIYVGLETNEVGAFNSNFWHFAEQHDIHKPKKHYMSYSGPPLATCKSDHVSVFVAATATKDILEQYERFGPSFSGLPISWQAGIWMEAYWPTNACRIVKEGREVLAPMTGMVRMASNDTSYPVQDFKTLSDALTASLQSAFPNRAVRVFYYGGDKQ